MLVALVCLDKPDHLEVRKANREAHLNYIDKTGNVKMAGPLLNSEGGMSGSLIILTVEDLNAAQEWADKDPYSKAGLFQSVQLTQWNKVIG